MAMVPTDGIPYHYYLLEQSRLSHEIRNKGACMLSTELFNIKK